MRDFVNALNRAKRAYLFYDGNEFAVTSGDLMLSETVVFPEYHVVSVTDGNADYRFDFSKANLISDRDDRLIYKTQSGKLTLYLE